MARSTTHQIRAEMVANVLELPLQAGDVVEAGDTVVLLESMKMEIPVLTDVAGTVTDVQVAVGDVVQEGDPLVAVEPAFVG